MNKALTVTNNGLAGAFPTIAGWLGYTYAPGMAPPPPMSGRVTGFLKKAVPRGLSVTKRGLPGYPPNKPAGFDPNFLGRDFDDTTMGGTPGNASPMAGAQRATVQVWERSALSAELWTLYHTDGRFRQSVEKRIAAAVRPGFTLVIEPREGTRPRLAQKMQDEAEAMLRRTGLLGRDGSPNTAELANRLRLALMDADLFVQRVVTMGTDGTGQIVALEPMPGAQMQKETDDRGQFYDVQRAYVQMDAMTQRPVPTGIFAAWQINHCSWKRIGRERYGQFEYMTARDPSRSLDVLERSQEYRRVSNASRIKEHAIGTPESPGDYDTDVKAYKKANSVRDRAAVATADPADQLNEYFHNGTVSLTVHPSDPNLHQVDDLTYALDKAQAVYDTPGPLLGLNLANVPRDTLDLLLGYWQDDRWDDLKFVLDGLIEDVAFQILLSGCDPDAFQISMAPAREAFANAAEAITFVTKAMSNVLGAGMSARPYPLLTGETAITILAKWIGVNNAKEYVTKLEAQQDENHIDPDTVHQQQQMAMQPKMGVGNGAANSKNSAGGATTGYGQKMEGNKRTDGGRSTGGDSYKK